MTYHSIEIINARLVTLVSAERRTTIDVGHVYAVTETGESSCEIAAGPVVYAVDKPRTEVLRALFRVRA